MRATGIVRRVDDLGRITLPKEIRRNLKIKDYEPLEIYVNKDNIILKKYIPTTPTEILQEVVEYYSDEIPKEALIQISTAIDLIEGKEDE